MKQRASFCLASRVRCWRLHNDSSTEDVFFHAADALAHPFVRGTNGCTGVTSFLGMCSWTGEITRALLSPDTQQSASVLYRLYFDNIGLMFLGVVVASQMMTSTVHVHTAVVRSWLSRYHRQPFVITVNNTLFKYGSRKSHVTSKAVFFSRHAVHVIFVHPYVTHQMSNSHQLCWQSVFCNGRPLVEISVHPLRVGSKGNSKNLKGRKSSFDRSSIRNSICAFLKHGFGFVNFP